MNNDGNTTVYANPVQIKWIDGELYDLANPLNSTIISIE